ncbi:VOC family protein [Nocardia sp. NPDC051570]|uniref:VOC family protein n=1 Tax=Nocardia sp. NPDC051570 TaxID=3364324 RepID=UPI0037A80D51
MTTLPEAIFYPPFLITRASHVRLTVRDLAASRDFYSGVLGLIVSDETPEACYLRAAEEACHHSLVLELCAPQARPECTAIGMRVLTDDELDKAHTWFGQRGLPADWIDVPHQGRTLRTRDVVGVPVELCATMDVVDRRFGDHTAPATYAKRLDHYQLFSPDNNAQTAFYAELGFRISDAVMAGDDVEGAFLWRKGNTHDLVLFTGSGPRLHHFAYLVSEPAQVLRACDMAGDRGYGHTIERGPGRHPFAGALYTYFRDPDGHRVELFDGHYQTIDAELAPHVVQVEDSAQPWGLPGQASWYFEATPFQGADRQEPRIKRTAPTLEDYLERRAAGKERV